MKWFRNLIITVLVLIILFAYANIPANAADGDGVSYTRYSSEVHKFTDGNLVCYVIFSQSDGDHTILQCYEKER